MVVVAAVVVEACASTVATGTGLAASQRPSAGVQDWHRHHRRHRRRTRLHFRHHHHHHTHTWVVVVVVVVEAAPMGARFRRAILNKRSDAT